MKTKFNYIALPLVALFTLSSCYTTDFGSLNGQSGDDENNDSVIQEWDDESSDADAQKVVWSGLVGDSFYDGAVYSESSNNYYITTGEELAYLASLVNEGKDMSGKSFYMFNSIDLDNHMWTPIGGGTEFNGTFYGMGYTIQNFYFNDEEADWSGYAGIFGSLGEDGAIKELNVKDADIICDGQFGGIVGENYGTVESCTFNGDISASWNYVGGIAGRCEGGIIYNCSSSGSMYVDPSSNANTGSEAFGGIVGFTANGATIYYCYNEMDIDTAGNAIGGVVGYLESDSVIYSCYNTGDISGYSAVGGVVGYCCNAQITAVYNRGAVTGSLSYYNNAPSNIGGVVGHINDVYDTDAGSEYGDSHCNSTYSTGNVTGPEEGFYDLAGLIGLCGKRASYGYVIKDESMGYYYDSTWNIVGVDDGGGLDTSSIVISDIEALTQEEMLSSTGLLSSLNTGAAGYWKEDTEGVNDGYPILVGMEY